MNTFLLYWNPHFSSYKLEQFRGDFAFEGSFYGNYLDALFDYDRMPFDFNWSGQGRRTFYMDMDFDAVVDPSSDAVLPTASLKEAIPEVEWSKGKAGTLIAPELAERLQSLWEDHLEKTVFKGRHRE